MCSSSSAASQQNETPGADAPKGTPTLPQGSAPVVSPESSTAPQKFGRPGADVLGIGYSLPPDSAPVSSPHQQRHVFPSVPLPPKTVTTWTDFSDVSDHLHSERLRSQRYCCKSSIVGQSLDRSMVYITPLACKSWDCKKCGPRKRAALIDRIAAGKPERELTLTCPVGKFLTAVLAALAMKAAFTELMRRIRRDWGPCEYILVWELTQKDVPHCHVVLRGCYVAQKWISRQWKALGIGPIVYINSVKGSKLHAAHVCKYLAKANGQSARALAPLHVVQVSKNYDLAQEPRTAVEKYPDMVWVWDRLPPWEVARRFEEHAEWVETMRNPDGSFEIKMVPRPDPDLTADTAAFWAASPDLLLLPDQEGA
ncbi:hypothetical protein ES708_20041 [subsurface metagenome]